MFFFSSQLRSSLELKNPPVRNERHEKKYQRIHGSHAEENTLLHILEIEKKNNNQKCECSIDLLIESITLMLIELLLPNTVTLLRQTGTYIVIFLEQRCNFSFMLAHFLFYLLRLVSQPLDLHR